ncbi:unnamed protein product [Orchesella dallaii]|uniref:Uncharacterized protein n=1 Tax=Orchesella dallaii TaxID=48710 RepID=A0ABP1PL38_9HEXA
MALRAKLKYYHFMNSIFILWVLNPKNWNMFNSTAAQTIPTGVTPLDSLITSIFNGCTFQFLGSPEEFSTNVSIFGSKFPVRIDRLEYFKSRGTIFSLGRYVLTSQDDFPPKHLSLFAQSHLFANKLSHQCTVQLHFISSLFHPNTFISPIGNSAVGMVFYNENPDFVISVINRADVSKRVAAAFLANQWKTFPLSSIPLIATSSTLYLLKNYLGDTEKLNQNYTSEVIRIRKQFLSKNQMRHPLLIVGSYNSWLLGKSCGLLEVKLETEYHICTLHVLKTVYNYTLVSSASGIQNHIGQVSHGLVSVSLMRGLFLGPVKHRGYQHFEWIGYGSFNLEYRYIAFVNRDQGIDLISMFLPFDMATAIVHTIAFITFILILTKVLVNNAIECDHNKKTSIILFLKEATKFIGFPFTSVLQQGDGRVIETSRKASLVAGFFLLFCWLYPCTIIGGEYSGHLHSTLTTAPTPYVPATVEQLVMGSDMAYITTTWHTQFLNPGHPDMFVRKSSLKELMLPEMIQGLSSDKSNSSLNMFFEKLQNGIRFVQEDSLYILQNVSNRHTLYANDGKGKFEGNKQFAIINNEWDINLAIFLGKQLLPNYYLYVSTENSRFRQQNIWLGKRTYFHRLCVKGLAALVESGIHWRWFRHLNSHLLIEQQKLVDRSRTHFYAMVMLADLNLKRQLIDGSETIRLESCAPIFVCYGDGGSAFSVRYPMTTTHPTTVAPENEHVTSICTNTGDVKPAFNFPNEKITNSSNLISTIPTGQLKKAISAVWRKLTIQFESHSSITEKMFLIATR